MTAAPMSVARRTAAPASAAWQLRVAASRTPQWVVDMADMLARVTTAAGDVVVSAGEANPVRNAANRWPWRLDAALFGGSRALLPNGVASGIAPSDNALLSVDLVSTAPLALPHRNHLLLRVEGLPACRLAEGVEQALAARRGQVNIEALWSQGGRPAASVVWHCGIDERSRSRSVDMVADKLVRLAAHVVAHSSTSNNRLPKNAPDGGEVFVTPNPTWRALRHAARRLFWVDQWAITIHQNVADDVLLPMGAGIDLIPPTDRFWADPFLVREAGRLWVFFEEVLYATGRGHLACVSIDDTGEVSPARTVLRENCHLSYPQLISHAGAWYMLPESSANRNLVLYRADALPGPWQPVATLMSGLRVADATVHHDGSRWFITATVASERGGLNDELHVFSAPDLSGPWQPIASNPVRVDPASARPAGPWFRWQGQWVRPVQDCRLRYGRALQLLAVQRIDERGIDEESMGLLAPRPGSSLDCVHTYTRAGSDLAIDWLKWRRKGSSNPTSGYGDIELQRFAQPSHRAGNHAAFAAERSA